MHLNWLESIILGFVSGISEILPISAQAHRLLLLRMFGVGEETSALRFAVHIGALAALLFACQRHLRMILRERALLRLPRQKRPRFPNPNSLMEWRLLCNMTAWSAAGLLAYFRASALGSRFSLLAVFIFVNGLILALPSRLAQGDKDCRSMTPLDTLCIGLAGAISVLPGISPLGATVSAALMRGVRRTYAVALCLLLLIPLFAIQIALDLAGIVSAGFGDFSVMMILRGILLLVFSFAGILAGVEILRRLIVRSDLRRTFYYCTGLAMFTFILHLTV